MFSSSLQFSRVLPLIVFLVTTFVCPQSWAAQRAIVLSEKAIVYADQDMTSPLGYLTRGKKIKVGDSRLNNHSVYAFVLSGKVAYISAGDISTELDTTDPHGNLTGVRFGEDKKARFKSRYALTFQRYSSQISLEQDNGTLQNNDGVDWNGISFRLEKEIRKYWDAHFLANYFWSLGNHETFRMTEIGGGVGYQIFRRSKLLVKLDVDFLLIPYASYAYDSLFRVNGFGISTGTGLTASYRLGKNWGIEGIAALYYTKLFGFSVPGPYDDIAPSFLGARFGLGANYFF